jgi:hypothetical protein
VVEPERKDTVTMKLNIGNRVTEKDVRDALFDFGYDGRTATVSTLELFAIQRPGWVQVFSFRLRAKFLPSENAEEFEREAADNNETELWGVVLDDERIKKHSKKTQVWVFEDESKQRSKLEETSEGMLTCKTGQGGNLAWGIIILIGVLAIAIVASAIFQ